MTPKPAARIPDLHRSAFWIYGITATVMKDPFGVVLRHAAAAGWHDPAVIQETMRALIVLALMARQFLSAGIYFDIVYLEPESADRFPRRNYPFDFLFGLTELLMAVANSMIIATPNFFFDVITGLHLIWESVWLLASAIAGYSTIRTIAGGAKVTAGLFVVFAAARVFSTETTALAVLLVLCSLHIGYMIYHYAEA